MKEVRVSQASRDVARSTKPFGLSLGELALEREKLVAEKKKIELSITELNELFSSEQMRIRRKYRNHDVQESITEWITRRSKLNDERTRLVQKKNSTEQRLRDVKLEIRQLSGITKNVDTEGKYLNPVQMEQYTEGLRSVIHSELGLLLELRPLLRNLVRLRRKYLKATRKLELLKSDKENIAIDPLELLSISLKILVAFKVRLGPENITKEEREIISFIKGYLLIFEQLDAIGGEEISLEEATE